MKPGRKQHSIGSLMVLIALVALGLAYLRFLNGSLIEAVTIAFRFLCFFILSFAISLWLVFKPCFLLLDAFLRWRDSRALGCLPDGRKT